MLLHKNPLKLPKLHILDVRASETLKALRVVSFVSAYYTHTHYYNDFKTKFSFEWT